MYKFIGSAIFIAALLSGCADKKSPPLTGARVDIEDGKSCTIRRDAKRNVTLAKPVTTMSWTAEGKDFSHNSGHSTLPAKLRKLFELPVGISSGRIVSTPIVIRDKVIVFGNDSNIYAYNHSTGNLIWKSDIGAKKGIGGGICADGSKIFAATYDAKLVALDIEKGSIIWKANLSTQARNAPVAADGKVFVVNINNQTEAFNTDSGAVLWKNSGTVNDTSVLGTSSPAITFPTRDTLISAYSSGEVIATSTESGDVLWSYAISSLNCFNSQFATPHIKASPVIFDNIVYAVSYAGRTVAIDSRSGSVIWQQPFGGVSSPAIVGDIMFLLTGDNILYCMDRHDGAVVWQKQLPKVDGIDSPWHGPVIAGDRIYFTGKHGSIISMGMNGVISEIYRAADQVSVPAIVAQEKLFIVTDDGVLVIFGK